MSQKKVIPKQKVNLKNHYFEPRPRIFDKIENNKSKLRDLKIDMWNEFVESDLTGIVNDDVSVFPRVLPASYHRVISESARSITESIMALIQLPEAEVKAIFPAGPMRDYLIRELQILKYRPNRMVGTLRFDMAIVGAPEVGNPPKLLEINEIGYDGLARFPYINEVIYQLIPDLRKKFYSLDTTGFEIENLRRAGSSLARFQLEEYNWDEELLLRGAREKNYDLRLISPSQLGNEVDPQEMPLLKKDKVQFRNGKIQIGSWNPARYMISYALEIEDFEAAPNFYKRLIKEKIPQYSPFITSLFASKSILAILADPIVQRMVLQKSKSLESCILPAAMLDNHISLAHLKAQEFVIKHVDGYGGEQVFMEPELEKVLKRTPLNQRQEWVLQQRVRLNTFDIQGFLTRKKRTLGDLAVFVHYDWSQGQLKGFKMSGVFTRATNRSWKVNVSNGGAQVGIMFERGR